MQKIDEHIHYAGDHPDCLALLEHLELKLLNVCVAHDTSGRWRTGADEYRTLAERFPSRYAWCTSFDPPDFGDPGYVDRVLDGLREDFEAGAVACKVWKNIGMAIRKPTGDFLMVDDPLFQPIYEYVAQSGRTLLMHIADPLAAWQPLGEDNLHSGYFTDHPEWYMYHKPDYPSHRELMDARDNVLAEHPNLRVVGAHLASLAYDVTEAARRLDRYPNLAVDTSARLRDLAYQDPGIVRRFLLQYQDRVLFGTDYVARQLQSTLSEPVRADRLERIKQRYRLEFAYFESAHAIEIGHREVQGLGLAEGVLEKLYHLNAKRWYPGL